VLAITSLTRLRAPAKRLLKIARAHWAIENCLHYVRDVTFGEDASRVQTESAPQALAGLRNAVIAVLRHSGERNLAKATRHYAAHPDAAAKLLL
jgi:predicted transposase YbfD/YdcC